MKNLIIIFFITLCTYNGYAQTTGYLRNDTIKITNTNKNATLVLETASKGHGWYLKDVGNGKTQFVQAGIADVNHLQDSLNNLLHLSGWPNQTINGSLSTQGNLSTTGSIIANAGMAIYNGYGLNVIRGNNSTYTSGDAFKASTPTGFTSYGNSQINFNDNANGYFQYLAPSNILTGNSVIRLPAGSGVLGLANDVNAGYILNQDSAAQHGNIWIDGSFRANRIISDFVPVSDNDVLRKVDLNNYIPYTGATTDINLGSHSITADSQAGFYLRSQAGDIATYLKNGELLLNHLRIDSNSNFYSATPFVFKPDNSLFQPTKALEIGIDNAANQPYTHFYGRTYSDADAINSNDLVRLGQLTSNFLSYANATKDVDLGNHNITANGFAAGNAYLVDGSLRLTNKIYITTGDGGFSLYGASAFVMHSPNDTGVAGFTVLDNSDLWINNGGPDFVSLHKTDGRLYQYGTNKKYLLAGETPTYTDLNNYLPLTGGTITGDIQYNTVPVNGFSLINKSYVDNAITGITWKNAVRAKTITNITLSGLQTIDGVALVAGNRVLVNNQSDARQNGIYIVAASDWPRAPDADSGDKISTATVAVTLGTINKNTQWTNIDNYVPIIGTDYINFGQISGAGTYTNGTGIDLTGNVFSLNTTITRGLFSTSGPLNYDAVNGTFGIQQAGTLQSGYLSSSDFNTFAGKQNAGNYITSLAGEITASGPGNATATINKAISPTWTGIHTFSTANFVGAGINVGTITSIGRITVVQAASNDISSGIVLQNSNSTGALRLWVDAVNNSRISGNSSESTNVIVNGSGTGKLLVGTTTDDGLNKLQVAGAVSIARTVTDANPALIVNNSGSNFIQSWQQSGTQVAGINSSGALYATALSNRSSANNSYIDMNANGTIITRNISDANTGLIVNKILGTGNILDAQFAGSSKFNVDVSGTTITNNLIGSAGRLTLGLGALGASQISINGGLTTSTAFGILGFGINQTAATYTSTAAAGSPVNVYLNSYGKGTLTATNTQSISNLYGNFWSSPAVNTNVTAANIYTAGFEGNVLFGGNAVATQYRLSALNTAPSSSTATGATGEIRYTAGYIYLCTATNTWVRAALSSF